MRWSLTSGPIKWVGRRHRHESHTLRRRRPTERAQKKKISKLSPKNKHRQTNEITGALAFASQVEHRYNNKRNSSSSSSSNVLDNHLATCRDLRDPSTRSIAAPPRRCFLFHFNLLLLPSRKIAAREIVRVEFVVPRQKRSERNSMGNSSSLQCLEALMFLTQRLCLLRAGCINVD